MSGHRLEQVGTEGKKVLLQCPVCSRAVAVGGGSDGMAFEVLHPGDFFTLHMWAAGPVAITGTDAEQ